VLSARPGFFEGFKSSCKVSELVELDDPKIKGYIHKYLGKGDKADTLISRIFDRRNERLKLLCKNPMMLHLVIWLQENDKIADDRAGIYRESVEGIITHYREKGKTLSSNEQHVRDVLKELAFSVQKENTVRLDYGSALDVAGSCTSPERYKGVSAEQVLEDCFGLGLLHKDGDEVRFGFHQSFQEYFAAVKLKDIFEYGYDISESFSHPKWEDTLVFLSEIAKRPDELFDDVIGAGEIRLAAKLTLHVDDRRVENLCALLLDAVDSEFDLKRDMAVESFAHIGGRATEALIGLLGDEMVAFRVAGILEGIGSEKAGDALIDAVWSGNPSVQEHMMWSFMGIGGEPPYKPLIDGLHHDNPSVRSMATERIGRMGGETAVDALIDARGDDVSSVRSEMAEALGETCGEGAVELLTDALHHDDLWMRRSAVYMIKSLCGPVHKEKFKSLLKSDDRVVASAAFEILHSIKLKEQEKIKIFKELKYLLRWDSISGNDSDKLLKYLLGDHGIAWAERAKIRKSDDKTLIISKDENSAEIKIDEMGEKATLKLSDGRTCELNVRTKKAKSGYTTQSVVKDAEEMFKDRHIGALVEHLKHISGSLTIVDYGCGKGAFLCVMKNLEAELGKIHYIGVDRSRGNLYLSGRTAERYDIADKLNSCRFMKLDKFLNESVTINRVFFVHVLHEIALKDLPKILHHLLSNMNAGSIIIILEQIRLVEPERDFVTWTADDFDMLFSGFAEVSPYPYSTKSEHELITVGAKKLDKDVDLKSISKRCLEVYEHKKERVGKERKSADLSDDGRRYLTELYANIVEQMDEYQKSIEMDK
jgi:HEAT repeat protein